MFLQSEAALISDQTSPWSIGHATARKSGSKDAGFLDLDASIRRCGSPNSQASASDTIFQH